MTFEFKTKTQAKLAGVNVRSELHGKEHVPAVDLKITVNAGNSILGQFDPNLLEALYFCAAPAEDDQVPLDGVEPITHLPNLRFPKLGDTLAWQFTGAGYEFTLDFGLGGDSNLVIGSCQVNNIRICPKEGGKVELSFRVQASNVDEHILGKLSVLVQQINDGPESSQQNLGSLLPSASQPKKTPRLLSARLNPYFGERLLDLDRNGIAVKAARWTMVQMQRIRGLKVAERECCKQAAFCPDPIDRELIYRCADEIRKLGENHE